MNRGTAVVAFALLVAGAPLLAGLVTRTKAVFAGRRGAPVWQLYADLWKLWNRGVVYSATTTGVFRLAPPILLVTTLLAAALLPLDGLQSLIAFPGDVLAFAYLMALGRFILVLASLDTGSSFEGMGASREVAFASLAELGLFVVIAALAVASHSLSLGQMLGTATEGVPRSPAALGAVATFAIALAECSRVPVDDPATHLELTMVHEVMILDHSGPDLAMIMYAGALKLAVFASFAVLVLVPGSRGAGVTGVATIAAGCALVAIAVGVVESVMARLRLPRVPLYLASAAALALFGLILELR